MSKSDIRQLAPRIVILVLAAVSFVTACGDDDVFDKEGDTKVHGTAETITVDGADTIAPAVDARVEFIRDPGANTLEDRVTFVDANGRYELKVNMYESACAPVRYSLLDYYEQDHIVCEGDDDQTIDVLLVSTEEPAAGRSCQTICDRVMDCEQHFAKVYESRDECLSHCQTGCDQDAYFNCAYQYGIQEHNINFTCEGMYACFGNYCDASWRDSDDDDSGDDDSGDDDAGDDDDSDE